MHIQNSYSKSELGTLYLVPTPIGNLEDMTFRAINILREVAVIAAEDTRQTKKLLTHFEIDNPMLSYHEHNRASRADELFDRLNGGEDIALVSDAGMPAISDPGFELVQEAIAKEINVVVLPGANAALCALVGSGLSTDTFLFYGFLPRKKQAKISELQRLSEKKATLIFYESPYRIKDTVRLILEELGDRQLSVAREITKLYEQYIRGTASEVAEWLSENNVKGECCIVVEGNSGEALNVDELWWSELSIENHVKHYEKKENISHKVAMKQVAEDRNVSRRDIYQQIHVKTDMKE